MMQNELVLAFIVAVEIKDDIVDTLMGVEEISGFTLYPVNGFSKNHSLFNNQELVEGYRRFYKFEISHTADNQQALLKSLQPVCTKSKVRYWIYDLNSSGIF